MSDTQDITITKDINIIRRQIITGAILHLTEDELFGIAKFIGASSVNRRVDEFGLTYEQSRALSKFYSRLSDALGRAL